MLRSIIPRKGFFLPQRENCINRTSKVQFCHRARLTASRTQLLDDLQADKHPIVIVRYGSIEFYGARPRPISKFACPQLFPLRLSSFLFIFILLSSIHPFSKKRNVEASKFNVQRRGALIPPSGTLSFMCGDDSFYLFG